MDLNKYVFLGIASIGVSVFGRHLYNALVNKKEIEDVAMAGDSVAMDKFVERGRSTARALDNKQPSEFKTLDLPGTFLRPSLPVYVVILNKKTLHSPEQMNNYVRSVNHKSQQRMRERHPDLLNEWIDSGKLTHVVKVANEGDMLECDWRARKNGVLSTLMAKGEEFIALGIGPTRVQELNGVLLWDNKNPESKPVICKTTKTTQGIQE